MKRLLIAFFLLLCLLIAPASAEVFVSADKPADLDSRELLRVTFFKVGEGDAMLIECGGEVMIMDGGPDKFRADLKTAIMETRGLTHVKYIFSTHPHDDHISGLYRLMSYGVTADEFLSPFKQSMSNDLQKKAVKAMKKAEIPYRQIADGDTLLLGDAVLTVMRWDKGGSINELSAMSRIEFKDTSILLCADVTGLGQKYFLEAKGDALKSTLVKAPHHGIQAFVKEFLNAVDPEYVVITNYTTGTKGIDTQLKSRDLPYIHTGHGSVVCETDGTDWYILQERGVF